MIATSLTPYIGYDKSAKVVKEAYKRGCSIKEIILEEKLMTEDELPKQFAWNKISLNSMTYM